MHRGSPGKLPRRPLATRSKLGPERLRGGASATAAGELMGLAYTSPGSWCNSALHGPDAKRDQHKPHPQHSQR